MKIVIVGAGISGLSAGIYALQSGFDVDIFESHTIPGGASTSWRRKGYLFEGGMHWLTGSSPQTPLHQIWREVGALDDSVRMYNRDPFFAFEHEGRRAYLYRDVEKLRRHFLELAPEDEREINRLCKDIRKFTSMSMPVTDIKGVKTKTKHAMSLGTVLSMVPSLLRMPFYAGLTVREYAARFQSPLLRHLLESIVGPDYGASAMIFTMATLASGDGGYPEGGSLGMALRMAKRFEALGGTIHYSKKVEQVMVERGTAQGVMVGGAMVEADAVIVTQDTLAAIDGLFDPPIREPWAERMRESTIPMLDTFVSLGVEADLSDLPERIEFVPEQPLMCGDVPQPVVGICNYAGYQGYAPEGCSAVTSILLGDSYDFWKKCREKGTYEAEKEKLAQELIGVLVKKFPQMTGKVAVWDVATPLTYERYLGSFKGSWMTAMGKGKSPAAYPSQPEQIQRLYFAGQRLRIPGGLPVAVESGRKAVQYLCRDTDQVFQGNS